MIARHFVTALALFVAASTESLSPLRRRRHRGR